MTAQTTDLALIRAYFERRHERSFCVTMCPNHRELSDTCAVADGEQEPTRCPDLANLRKDAA